MIKKYLGIGVLVMASQLTTMAHGVRTKVLEAEAEGISSNIWSGIQISSQKIKDSLGFLEESDISEPKYTKGTPFKDFYEKNINGKVKDAKFIKFAEECSKLYADEGELPTKVAVLILLERVTEIYKKDLRKAEILKSSPKDSSPRKEPYESKHNVLELMLNADKDISVR